MSGGPPWRVLIVDDSAFARKVLRESVSSCAELEVIGIAHDGLEALDMIAKLQPDVITLDLMMPHLDGLGVLRALSDIPDAPAVVVVSTADNDGELGIAALAAGAFELVHKPTALALDQLYDLGHELVAKVLAAGAARGSGALSTRRPSLSIPLAAPIGVVQTRMVLIGASTGGPHAVNVLLRALPKDFPVPVAVVVHLPPGYTDAFARRLDGECALDVVEASDELPLEPGRVVIARAGLHLRVRARGDGWVSELSGEPSDALHRPSVDVLFESAARSVGDGALGVVLTGMGSDGLVGSRAIHAAGGRLLTEAESSAVVYGMPRCVFEDGIATASAPLEDLGALLLAYL